MKKNNDVIIKERYIHFALTLFFLFGSLFLFYFLQYAQHNTEYVFVYQWCAVLSAVMGWQGLERKE